MLLLFETPAGFSLFKVKDEKKLDDVEVRRDRSIVRGRFRRPAARIVVLIDRSVDPRGRARAGRTRGARAMVSRRW